MGKTLMDMMVIAGYLKASITLAMHGFVSAEAVALGALVLVIFLLCSRRKPLTFKSFRRRIVFPAAGFCAWVQEQGHGDAVATDRIWQGLLTLLIMLFGFYFMLGGIFRRNSDSE